MDQPNILPVLGKRVQKLGFARESDGPMRTSMPRFFPAKKSILFAPNFFAVM
ncbi:hypothetical protein [Paraburkholderia susongensis]|uniref:hypothetical protein n=1 Tax=Paraburkholderia susongensis TaxID=1515439 RepID=UPI00142E249D|nr:hypothetical protein [Paraburkholderia susongensis]